MGLKSPAVATAIKVVLSTLAGVEMCLCGHISAMWNTDVKPDKCVAEVKMKAEFQDQYWVKDTGRGSKPVRTLQTCTHISLFSFAYL